jgi:hypothetical protein
MRGLSASRDHVHEPFDVDRAFPKSRRELFRP